MLETNNSPVRSPWKWTHLEPQTCVWGQIPWWILACSYILPIVFLKYKALHCCLMSSHHCCCKEPSSLEAPPVANPLPFREKALSNIPPHTHKLGMYTTNLSRTHTYNQFMLFANPKIFHDLNVFCTHNQVDPSVSSTSSSSSSTSASSYMNPVRYKQIKTLI